MLSRFVFIDALRLIIGFPSVMRMRQLTLVRLTSGNYAIASVRLIQGSGPSVCQRVQECSIILNFRFRLMISSDE